MSGHVLVVVGWVVYFSVQGWFTNFNRYHGVCTVN